MPVYEVTSPDGRKFDVTAPEGATQEEVLAYAKANFDTKPKKEEGDFVRGFKSYGPQAQELLGGAQAFLGAGAKNVLGEGDVSNYLFTRAKQNLEESEKEQKKTAKKSDSLSDAYDQGIATVVTDWLPYTMGQGAANMLETIGMSVAGAGIGTLMAPGAGTAVGAAEGLVGGTLLKQGIKEGAKAILERELKAGATKEAALTAAKEYTEAQAKKSLTEGELSALMKAGASKIGSRAGTVTQALGHGMGEVGSRAASEQMERGLPLPDLDFSRIGPAAAVHATADYIAERIGLGAFKGLSNPTKNMLLNMSKNWLTVGSKELTPELVQTAAERYGAALPLDDQKALKEYIDTAGATYGMSLLPGAIGGMRTRANQAPAEPAAPPDQEQAPVVQPEIQAPQGVDLSQMTRAGVSPESLMGSMAGMNNINEQMISEQRRQQAQMMAEEERQRKAQINEIMQTNYSSDPTVNEATKKRMLANLGFTQPAAPEMVPPQPTPAGVPGGVQGLMGSMTGTRDVNANMLAQARAQQEQQAGAEERQRQAEIKQALNTVYSRDPIQNEIVKRRVLESLGYKEPEPEQTMTPEEWAGLTPEERQFEMQRMAAAEAADRSRRKSKGFKGQWTPEELAAMGIEQGEKKKTAPAIKATEHPDNIGVIGTDEQGLPIPGLLSEGAKPFASKDVANYVRKLQPMMKAVQLPNGQYVLSPKTEAELAREGKSKIHLPSTGEKGPQTAHDFIVANGGIRFADQSKTDFPDQNPKVGNRNVFQQNGKSIAKMAELLYEAGYIAEESENAVSDILSKSLKNPQYTSEGFERVGEQELEQQRKAEEKAELESGLTAQTAEEMGYPNTPLEIAQANISYARNLGLDVDSILEQAHEDTRGQSDDAFHDRISELVRQSSGPIVENQMQAGFDFGEPTPAPAPQATTTRARPEKPPVLTPPPGFKLKKGRNEQVVLAAKELAEDRITKKEYDQYVDYYMPVGLVEKPEPPMSLADMKEVLTSAQEEKIDSPIPAGTKVGLRMDINALVKAQNKGMTGSVVAIHPQNNPKSSLSYSGAAHVTNATFAIRSEKAAMKVAMNEADKAPQQTIEGSWVPGKPEDIYAKVQQLLKDPAWSQISLDPLRHSFFYDRATMQPVVAADEVYQVGRFVLAKNVQYEERKNFMYMRDASLDAIGMVDNFAAGYAESKVVYQKGDLSLVRVWSSKTGRPIYLGANTKTAKATRVDIRDDKSDTFTEAQKRLLLNQIDKIEDQEKKKHQNKPFIKFDKDGVAVSANITPELRGILTGLKDLLGVKANIYIGTVDDVMSNINNYTGPHREISVIIGDKNKLGTMVRVSNGDYFIVFTNQASKAQEIETMAHELGHIHQLEVFDRADEQTKKEITDEYFNWLSSQKDKTAKELVQSLRARKVGKHNVSALEGMSASDLRAYWTKFAEWYADQVSRWATTSEKPLSVVEKFFYRLAQAMKSFYAKLRNQKYLPTTTMKKFLDSMKKDAADIENKGQLEMFMQAPQNDSFEKWFRNSKVVDENGNPAVVYRGITTDVSTSMAPSDFFESSFFGKGINLTSSPEDASKYASTDAKVNLDLTGKASIMADKLGISYQDAKDALTQGGGAVVPLYASIKNPLTIGDKKIVASEKMLRLALAEIDYQGNPDAFIRRFNAAKNGQEQFAVVANGASRLYRQIATMQNKDGLIIEPSVSPKAKGATHYLAFDEDQIRSAFEKPEVIIQNQLSAQSVIEGAKTKAKKALQTRSPMEERAFDGMNPDTALEVQRIFFAPNKTIVDRLEGMKDNFFQTLAQKTVDQFRTIRDYSPIGYMQARLSTATDGALEGLLFHGHVKNVDGALDIKQGTKGLIDALQPLGHEVDRFQVWMALSREANLPDSKRSEQLRELVGRRGEFVAGSHNGKPRAELYESVRKDLMALNRSVLKVALDSGTIDQEAYDRFASDAFYIPFYKMMEDGNIESIRAASRLTNQQFSKALKGNNDKPFGDLMENTLRNWSHILSSSMKNQAAVTIVNDAMEVDAVSPNLKAGLTLKDGKVYSMKTGEMVGDGQLVQTKLDEEGQEYQVNMTEAGNQAVKVMMEGQPVYFAVNDPMLLESIGAINFAGSQSKIVDVLRMFKNTLRFGVTASPIFKANNLIKDSIQAAGVSGLGFNFVKNVMSGLADSGKGSPVYQSALAGGGVFNYGTTLEGDRSEAVKKLIALGVKPDTILTDKEHITHALKYVWHKYEELGNKSEAANRIALYKKLRAEGKSHLEASYHARDLLDYSMQGSSGAMRFLCQVVPFLGARSQGLYKLGRDGLIPTTRVFYNTVTGKPIDQTDAQKAKAFSTVSMGVMLASMALYLAFKDDEDFKKREQWDRDYFWWFKVPGTELALRIPKPFEFGSLGTLAERTLEQIIDDSVESKVFTESLSKMVWQTFSMNPTPQLFKPMIDIYANKESFTSAPIETHGMERLSKQERKTDKTSPLAIALGGVSHAVANVFGESSELSPVQIDYLIRAYFGWLGGTAQSASQYAMMPFKDGSYPDADWTKRLSLGFVQNLPSQQSRYVTSFYQNNQLIQQAYADMRHYAAFNQMDKVQEIMEEKGDLIALQKMYDQRSKVMANVRKQILHISDPNNTTMDGAQKKEEILRLRMLMSDIAQQAEDFRVNRLKEKI